MLPTGRAHQIRAAISAAVEALNQQDTEYGRIAIVDHQYATLWDEPRAVTAVLIPIEPGMAWDRTLAAPMAAVQVSAQLAFEVALQITDAASDVAEVADALDATAVWDARSALESLNEDWRVEFDYTTADTTSADEQGALLIFPDIPAPQAAPASPQDDLCRCQHPRRVHTGFTGTDCLGQVNGYVCHCPAFTPSGKR